MAAGLGFKTFQTGEVLTASDVNGYLMQGILVFATEAARNSAITSPQEGQFAFTKDNNSLWYYTGSAWVASGATGDIEGVTAGVGISGGGTSGTVTITNSMATAIDAKGDLIGGTGADTFAKLTVGANDTVLTADSSTATGLKWAAPASASGPAFKARRTADQTVASANTWTKVQFNADVFDTDNCYDPTTNYRFTPTKAGYYQFNSKIYFPIANDKVNFLALYKNGTIVAQSNGGTNGTNANMAGPPGISDIQSANGTTDYFECYAYSTSAGNDIGGGAEQVTYFSGVWIRGL